MCSQERLSVAVSKCLDHYGKCPKGNTNGCLRNEVRLPACSIHDCTRKTGESSGVRVCVNLLLAFERKALKRRKAFAVAICQGTLGDDERDRGEVEKKEEERMNEKKREKEVTMKNNRN